VLRLIFVMNLILALFFIPTSVQAAVEAIQLEHVPIDSSLECDRIFFRSSQNFKNTIYVLPIVIPQTDEFGEAVMSTDIDPQAPAGKKYVLNFQIYFPSDDAATKARTHVDQAGTIPTCNFAKVKRFLNQRFKGEEAVDAPDEEKIHTISAMPLTSIEVSLPTHLNSTAIIGRPTEDSEADIIAYQAATFNVTLPMNDAEKQSVLEALSRDEGLQARIRLRFKAHRQVAALDVTIDMNTLAGNFRLAANGKKYIAKAKLDLALRAAMNNTRVSINITGGDDAFNELVKQVVEKVMTEVKLLPDIAPAKIETETGEAAEEGMVEVAAVVDILTTKVNSSFSINKLTAAETATAEVHIPLRAVLGDPNIRVLRVVSGEDTMEPTLGKELKKGQTIVITNGYYLYQELEYKEFYSFLTTDELPNYVEKIEVLADLLSVGGVKVTDEEWGTEYLAVGKMPWFHFQWWNSYSWKRISRGQRIRRTPRTKMGTEAKDYARFPVFVSFTNLGAGSTRIDFADLMHDTEDWFGRLDPASGSIIVTAKRDLGLMVLRSRFRLHENNDQFDLKDELREKCEKLTGSNERMDCYFPACSTEDWKKEMLAALPDSKKNDLEYVDKYLFDKKLTCRAVDHSRGYVVLEELIQRLSDPWTTSEAKPYIVTDTGRGTFRRRVLYYYVTLPEFVPLEEQNRGISVPEDSKPVIPTDAGPNDEAGVTTNDEEAPRVVIPHEKD